MRQLVLSFDIGIHNLAFTLIEYDDLDLLVDLPVPVSVIMSETCDITDDKLLHRTVPLTRCRLFHNKDGSIKNISDRVAHFLQEYEKKWLEYGNLSEVFIEQQPLQGVTSVEALLFQHYRDIVTSVSPVAMHKFLGIRHLDYHQRKEVTTTEATPFLKHLITFMNFHELQNHQADSLCLFCYEIHKRHQEKLRELYREDLHEKQQRDFEKLKKMSIDDFFEQFRYSGHKRKSQLIIPENFSQEWRKKFKRPIPLGVNKVLDQVVT